MRSRTGLDPHPTRTNWIVVGLVLIALAIALIPVLLHLPPPAARGAGITFVYLPALLAAAACYQFDRTFSKKEKAEALFICLAFAFLSNYLHLWLVDLGPGLPASTLDWQINLHKSVIDLRPEVLPHSYRFLPNSLVRLFEQVTGDFSVARDSYRNLFGVLLFYALYRFARLFLLHGGALFSLALWTVVSPVSFRYYLGQLTDPMSHLSFILAFIFIETEQFVYLVLTLMIGCLAKETVLAMIGYYALFRWREKSHLLKLTILIIASLAVYLAARAWVLHGVPDYAQISGVALDHLTRNWADYSWWVLAFLYTVGIFVPFVIAGWRKSPWKLRSLALYFFPVLLISSLFFSWLWETRNFMPLVAVLTVSTVYHLMPGERAHVEQGTP
jgi:hypothetical protein